MSNSLPARSPATAGTAETGVSIEVGRLDPTAHVAHAAHAGHAGHAGGGAAPYAEWNALVARHPDATVAHLGGWSTVVRRTYGHPTHHLAARAGGELVGVLALVEVRSRLFGASLTSMPYLDTGGILATDPAAWPALLGAARELAAERGIARLDLREAAPPPIELPVRAEKVTLLLELGDSEDALWQAIGSKTRNQVRKGQKAGLRVRRAGTEGLDDFYRVYATNMRDLGSPPHRRRWFAAILEELGDAAGCHLVEHQGEVIGGLIAIDHGRTVTVPWASSDRRHFRLCPNNVLYWETMRAALARGMRRFDFGRSSRDSGTYRFKRQWGASEQPLHWVELRAGTGSVVAPALGVSASPSRLRRAAAGLWRRQPVATATWLGSRLRGGITL